MNIPKITINKIEQGICLAAGISAICAGLTTSCANSNSTQEESIKTEVVAKPSFAKPLENDVFEPTKPNLPIIEGDNIAFKNTDNEVIKIKDDRYDYISSLYKAILKHSTNEQPNIVDTEKFYMDVEKNFSKKAFSDSPAINSALESGYIAISNMFDRLYRVVTDDRSQEGKTITVEEYTNMMDTWSSLDYKVPDKPLKESLKDAFGL